MLMFRLCCSTCVIFLVVSGFRGRNKRESHQRGFVTQAFALATLKTGAVEACRSEMGVRHDAFVLLFRLFYTVGGFRID